MERIVSAYYHYIKTGFLPPVHINEGLPKVLSGDWLTKYPRSKELLEYGFYHRHLERYLHFFERKKIKVYIHKDIKKEPEKVIEDMYKFLEVEESFTPAGAISKMPKASVYDLDRLARLQRANRYINRYSENGMRMHRTSVNENPISYLKCSLLMMKDYVDQIFKGSGKKPDLSAPLRNKIHKRYAEDIRQLESLLGRDLEDWKT